MTPAVLTLYLIMSSLQIVVSYGYDLQESPLWYKQGWERCEVRRHGVSLQCLVSTFLNPEQRRCIT